MSCFIFYNIYSPHGLMAMGLPPMGNVVDLKNFDNSKPAPYVSSHLTGEGQDGGENSYIPKSQLKSTMGAR